jgi:polar amino acid transport system permease protein
MSIFETFLNWKVFVDTLPLLLRGLWITIGLGASAIVLGAAGGLLLALLRLYAPAPVRFLTISYINVFRAIPILVLLIVIYYALPF